MFKEGETTFIAVEPKVFTKMVELEYLQGDPATALQQLADGRHLFVSKEFYNVRKLGVGDHINLAMRRRWQSGSIHHCRRRHLDRS